MINIIIVKLSLKNSKYDNHTALIGDIKIYYASYNLFDNLNNVQLA